MVNEGDLRYAIPQVSNAYTFSQTAFTMYSMPISVEILWKSMGSPAKI